VWHVGAPPRGVRGRNRTTGATGHAPEQRSAGYPVETRCDARCDQGPRSRSDNDSAIGDPSPHVRGAIDVAVADLPLRRSGLPCRPLELGLALDRSRSFNEPFSICLTQAWASARTKFIFGTTPLPATTSIDWVGCGALPPAQAEAKPSGTTERLRPCRSTADNSQANACWARFARRRRARAEALGTSISLARPGGHLWRTHR
jgi:hypothetical protein